MGMMQMEGKYSDGKKTSDGRRNLFERRKDSTERMAKFNKRFFDNLRKNWEIKQEDHLLPNAKTIFNLIDNDLPKMDILKNPDIVTDWHHLVDDEEFCEERIQESIAILSWVYWQRLEGYETMDVSLSREHLVEDVGCIQQLYNAADGLIREYQMCFDIYLPIDIMCVYGLYQHFRTSFRHFVMVPNQTRYEYILAWISVAHEVAHIAIDEMNNYFNKYFPEWLKKERIRKQKEKIKRKENIKEGIINPKKVQKQIRKGKIPLEVLEIHSSFNNTMRQICPDIKDNNAKENFQEISKKFDEFYSKIKECGSDYANGSREQCSFLCKYIIKYLDGVREELANIGEFVESLDIQDNIKEELGRKMLKIDFSVHSLIEVAGRERLSQKLLKNPEKGNIDEFFRKWRDIKKRAVDIAETILHVLEGDSGIHYLYEINDPKDMRHIHISEQILADIIAALIAGEFYVYSLVFYRFLPSVFPSKEGVILRKQWMPMSLRLFICLETLKYSKCEDMNKAVKKLEELWIESAADHEKSERVDREIQEAKAGLSNNTWELTVDLLWNLIRSIIEEDSYLESKYRGLLKKVENNKEEEKEKFDRSYFNYMRHSLGNALKKMLLDKEGFLLGAMCNGNCLKELVELIGKNLIDSNALFTDERRYVAIQEFRKHLTEGELVLHSKEKYNTPRNILSAYAQIFFEYILLSSEKAEREYIEAFNSTVMSMAWTQYALERFYDGETGEKDAGGG